MDFIRFCTFFSEVRQFFYHTLPYYYWFFHIIMDSSISFPHSVPLQIVINCQIITDSSTFLTDFSIFFTDYYIVSWFSLVSRSSIFFQIFYGFFQILPDSSKFLWISTDCYRFLQITCLSSITIYFLSQLYQFSFDGFLLIFIFITFFCVSLVFASSSLLHSRPHNICNCTNRCLC